MHQKLMKKIQNLCLAEQCGLISENQQKVLPDEVEKQAEGQQKQLNVLHQDPKNYTG